MKPLFILCAAGLTLASGLFIAPAFASPIDSDLEETLLYASRLACFGKLPDFDTSIQKAEQLVQQGARVNSSFIEKILENYDTVYKCSDLRRHLKTVEFSLQHGADPNFAGTHDSVPVLGHTGGLPAPYDEEAAQLLLKFGADKNARFNLPPSCCDSRPLNSLNLLRYALTRCKSGLAHTLIDANADLDYPAKGQLLLDVAHLKAEYGCEKIRDSDQRLIIKAAGNLNVTDQFGISPLMYALKGKPPFVYPI